MKKTQRNTDWRSFPAESLSSVTTKHRKLKIWQHIVSFLSIIVILCASYAMILPTITEGSPTHVGFSKLSTGLNDYEYARLEGGIGPRKFYLAPKEVYDQYTNITTPTYAAQEALIVESEITYCFNHYMEPPTNTFNQSKRSEYTENEDTSSSLLYSAASSHVRIKNADNLYQKILTVLLNGYKNDYSGIQAKYGLSNDVFRAITQYAIWYYTDSISIYTYNDTYNNKSYYYMYADDGASEDNNYDVWLTKNNNGNRVWIPYTDSNWLDAYEELLFSSVDSTYIRDYHINLYENTTGAYKNLITVGQKNSQPADPPYTGELKAQITAKKTIDGGAADIGSNKFNFRITGHGQDVTVQNDENGDIRFPEISYTQPGTYTYTIEELTDERDGVLFDFDKSKKTVTVTVSEQQSNKFNPDAKYYAFEESDENFDYFYYADTVPGNKGIIIYCTYQGVSGPQWDLDYHPVQNQTYRLVINPTIEDIENNNWVASNPYNNPGENLIDNLKKLFYYFETEDSKKISNGDKQSLVWTATGSASTISSISVNNMTASNNAETVLDNIYATVTAPSSYNLAFFIPTDTQLIDHPQPLATGYRGNIEITADDVVFNNPSINSLKIGKTVSGAAGETDREFNFTISLMDNSFGRLSGTYTVVPNAIEGVEAPNLNSITFTDGIATVKLKHGQDITITGLPDNFYYTITEAEWNADNYTSSVTKGASGNMSGSGATGLTEVEFTNNRDIPPPPTTTYEAVIEATKTLNGELPADGQFTFILKNAEGEEVARTTNDAEGKITFSLTFTEMGTYTYTIEELNDGQEGITYDTEVKTVIATVTEVNPILNAIRNADSLVGSREGKDDLIITINGTTKLDVYCIDGDAGNPKGTYDPVFNPTTPELEQLVTHNYYGTALSENMRKLLYYFDTHSYTDKVNNRTLSKSFRQSLVWSLTGYSSMQDPVYKTPLNTILNDATSIPPDNYTVVMFSPLQNGQPVITGYFSEVIVNSDEAKFENLYEYILPETGGMGTKSYAIGGLLLMGCALLLMYKNCLSARRRGER